ncbi:MAG: hypothetical protein EOM69_05335 [Clostridia bacterium]|nr:hypothetical protein [Clostridia bacterium]
MLQKQSVQSWSAWLTALFFILLIGIGLYAGLGYGQPWDEPWEQDILRLNGNQYLTALGQPASFVMDSTMTPPASGLIADSEERDHGVSAYYPLLWLVGQTSLSPAQRMMIWHAYTWLWFMAGTGALWLICRRLGLGRLLSSVAALFLSLSPRMFAEGHYNNKDMVLLSLVLLVVWLGLRLADHPNVWRAALFSLAGAIAANTKIVGLGVWGLCALFVLTTLLAQRRMNGRAWGAAAVTLLAFSGFYLLLTPAMWADPLGFLRYLMVNAVDFTRWENDILYRGTIYHLTCETLPRTYLPYMILVTTPLWLLALIGVGQVLAIARMFRRGARPFVDGVSTALLLCTLLWLFPLAYAVLGKPNMYNGWRHFYFVYGPLLIMAVYGVQRLSLRIRKKTPRRLAAGALALCLGLSAAGIAWEHPYQYAYYSPVLRNARLGERFELDYWNVSVEDGLKRLYEAEKPTAQIPLRIAGADPLTNLGLCNTHAVLPRALRDAFVLTDAADADYLLSNPTYAQIYLWEPSENMRVAASVQAYGQTLMLAYRVTR